MTGEVLAAASTVPTMLRIAEGNRFEISHRSTSAFRAVARRATTRTG